MSSKMGWRRNFSGGYTPSGSGYVTQAIGRQNLDRAEKKGYDDGYRDGHNDGQLLAGMEIVRCCYAGICLVLNEQYEFDDEKCCAVLKGLDEKVLWALNHRDLAEEVLDKIGLTIDFNETFDRVRMKDRRIKEGTSK